MFRMTVASRFYFLCFFNLNGKKNKTEGKIMLYYLLQGEK